MIDFENDNTDRILDYLHERMNVAERKAFEEEVVSNTDLKRQLGLHIVLKEELTCQEDLKKKINAIFDELEKEEASEITIVELENHQNKHKPFPNLIYWATAASIILALGTWWWISQDDDSLSKPTVTQHQPIVKDTTTKTLNPKPNLPLPSTNQELALNDKLYIEYFDPQPALMRGDKATSSPNDSLIITKAINNLKNNKIDSAVKALHNYQTNSNNPWQQVGQWYLALGYLKQNDLKKAKKLFKTIDENPDHPYSFDAGKVLKQLK